MMTDDFGFAKVEFHQIIQIRGREITKIAFAVF